MQMDMVIQNGQVMDPTTGMDRVADIGVHAGRIVDPADYNGAVQTLDASGYYVFPGLIDFHSHIYYDGGMTPVKPDLMLAMGVTAAVDAGTSGCGNFDAFYKTTVVTSHLRIKSYLNVASGGLADEHVPENFNPALFNESGIRRVLDIYGDQILGLKIRMGRSMVDSIEPLRATLKLSERLGGLPVCVHATDPPCTSTELVELLRPGDIFCHMYHGRGSTILDADGTVREVMRRARDRGVIFDMANGRGNFCHDVALTALAQGFLPDVISTDMGIDKIYISPYARSLPFVMSKLLCMGMSLTETLRAVTQTPARLMGLAGRIGTLSSGACADIALFTLSQRTVHFKDFSDALFAGDKLLEPALTICRGEVVYARPDFNILCPS